MTRRALVIAGPSAVGKTSTADFLVAMGKGYELVRSVTTRAPRDDEYKDEYIYISREEFFQLKASGELLEDMEYGGEFYGTPIGEIERIFEKGGKPLLILDMNGVRSLRARELSFSVFAVYLYDDINVIEKRLYKREIGCTPTIEGFVSFIKRKTANIKDYISIRENHKLFDAFYKNERLALSANEIDALYRAGATFPTEDIAQSLFESVLSK